MRRTTRRVLIEDIGVPVPRIAELVTEVERIALANDTLVPVIGHAATATSTRS